MKKDIVVVFGGISPEHEVSIITGLQVLEAADQSLYNTHALYITKAGTYVFIPDISDKRKFNAAKRYDITLGRNSSGGFIQTSQVMGRRIYPYCAYIALHGGTGEGGAIQGVFESLAIPYTSPYFESSVLLMNKTLTKVLVETMNIPTIPSCTVTASQIKADPEVVAKNIEKELKLPVIIKPAHLGSSIGITIARTSIELQKYLSAASFIDSDVLVETYLSDIQEFNCAVRSVNGIVEASEIERPLSKDEILSFAEKYENGGKKVNQGGMSSLQRELPAHISLTLKNTILDYSKRAFIACKCTGMVRIDFIYSKNKELYLSEINAVPGSMAFYLWEAKGIPFKQQITDLIEESARLLSTRSSMALEYESSIVDTFINNP